ncbi:MAG: prepilin-type N-terminal cleavage/methylation domain-containing protein [Clostridiales bacterium]|jgi:prepilin-type N-terminal cleavage/methylation domain-containing protein|nr:prepilin-type N-terminal cleavage/methylation domain-containing protein [Clostridiales bacterium]
MRYKNFAGTGASPSGVTLLELVIVLAIIAIIGAILVPNFLGATEKARLKSDVQSARVIGNALDLYNAEQPAAMAESDIEDLIKELSDKGYIDFEQAETQTEKAVFKIDASTGGIVVDITACPDNTRKKIYAQLTPQERQYVTGHSEA